MQMCSNLRERSKIKILTVNPIPIPELASFITAKSEANDSKTDADTPASNWTSCGYSKLNLWSLTDYERLIYIDADCIVKSSLSELFTMDLGTAAFAAAPDIFPPDCFNAGVLVVRPDLAVFNDLVSKIELLETYDGGDTGFLNAYYNTWYTLGSENKLDFSYNAQRTMHWMTFKKQPNYWNALEKRPIKIIHFSSTPKPWEQKDGRCKLGELELYWWEIYKEMSMPMSALSTMLQ